MVKLSDLAVDLIIPVLILFHLVASPYTKVEESFNLQATHDLLEHGLGSINNATAHIEAHFDHVSFPGSVPRTFVGAVLLSSLVSPFGRFFSSSDSLQLLVRAVLGLLTAASLLLVRQAINTAYGKIAGRWFVLLLSSQFHIIYYASRTLPNIFAFILSNVAIACLIAANTPPLRSASSVRRRIVALACLTIAGVVFRSELAILLAVETVQLLLLRRAALVQHILPTGVVAVVLGLLLTVPVDSLLWRRWTWPELEGFYYNTILGKSSDWGTSPFHFYFSNAIPRLLLNPLTYLVCIPTALAFRATRQVSRDLLLPHLAFILVYSILPHKEWRFIIYSIPAFTAVASGGAAWVWNRRSKSTVFLLFSALLVASTLASFVFSTGLLFISSMNYPGGTALHALHARQRLPEQKVYLDNLACQTGVSRFLQAEPSWDYDKTEDKTQLSQLAFWRRLDYAIVEDPTVALGYWTVMESIQAFDGLTIKPSEEDDVLPVFASWSPRLRSLQRFYNSLARSLRKRYTSGYWPSIKMKDKLYILQKDSDAAARDMKLDIQM